ncbi:hypothetical protein CEP52_013615 [Fusarium oligoseptatum]|uniref:Uncharacterized protein n=1 Tax=Fusarium oligoseptatum TaxID=2604345 RepID=A0A428SSM6_9HYPO|nr:hypothetical protein CEP52_013615 [Fusarium oligoseptatum]
MGIRFCPHAILSTSAVTVIHYRKVTVGNIAANVARLFHVHKPIRWRREAIQVYEQTKKSLFLIAVNNSLSEPTLNNSDDTWMVAAPAPVENGHSAAVEA